MKYHVYLFPLYLAGIFLLATQAYTTAQESNRSLHDLMGMGEDPLLHVMQKPLRVIEPEDMAAIPDFRPVAHRFPVSSQFGMRIHPIYKKRSMHYGIDFPLPVGTPIRAASGGIIKKAVVGKAKRSFGNHITIQHDHKHRSLYAHLSEIFVEPGQEVRKGEVIGLSGNTGLSTSPHLHYEVFENGSNVDPRKFW